MSLSRIGRSGLVVLLSSACVAVAAQGQGALEGRVVEDIHGMRPQSAPVGLFVGLVQGPPSTEAADLTRLRVLLPRRDKPQQVCLSATTFDAVYSASAVLRAPEGAAGALRIGDPQFSRYVERVRDYADGELSVGFALSANCNAPAETTLLMVPASFGGRMDVLRVALNTRPPREMSVTLRSGDAPPLRGECRRLDDRRASAFRYVCDIRLSGVTAGSATLDVSRKMGGAPARTDSVQVLLASPR